MIRRGSDEVHSIRVCDHGWPKDAAAARQNSGRAEYFASGDENMVERRASAHGDSSAGRVGVGRARVVDGYARERARSAVVDDRSIGGGIVRILQVVNGDVAGADRWTCRCNIQEVRSRTFPQDIAEDPVHRAASRSQPLDVEDRAAGEIHILHAGDVNHGCCAAVILPVPNGNRQRAIGRRSSGRNSRQAALVHPEIKSVGEFQRRVVGLSGGLHAQAGVIQIEADGVVGPNRLVVGVNSQVLDRPGGARRQVQ